MITASPEDNLKWMQYELESEQAHEALLTVFPACTLCGAPLHAAAAYTDLQKRSQAVLQQLVSQSEHRAFLVGMPLHIQDKGLCNAVVFVQNGAIRGVVTKKYLGVEEQKYFVRGEGVQIMEFHDQRIAIGFYEDLKELVKGHVGNPDMVICCGCNVFDYQKPFRVRYRMRKIVETLGASLVYVNRVGGEGSLLYAGGSLAMNAAGGVLCQLPYCQPESQTVDMQLLETLDDEKPEAVELVYRALVMGISDYFTKQGLRKAVIGKGLPANRALVRRLAIDALGEERVVNEEDWTPTDDAALLCTIDRTEAAGFPENITATHGQLPALRTLAVVGDLYRSEVTQVLDYLGVDEPAPDTEQTDTILNLYLDEGLCVDEIAEEGYDPEVTQGIVATLGKNEWRRRQMPPQLKVSPMSFGIDWMWPEI